MLIEEDQNTELHLSRSETIEVKDLDVSECNSVLTCEGCDVSGGGPYLRISDSLIFHTFEIVIGMVDQRYLGIGQKGCTSDELKLCEEMSKIIVNNVTAKFTGKHTRFVYNSDVEFARELESSSKIEEKEERLV
ncbi:hypothetical protein Tco_0981415 [Tanacetum coccineum]